MKRIAIFLSHYSLANSPSIVNFVLFLARQNRVDLFLESVAHTEVPEFMDASGIELFMLDRPLSLSTLRAGLRRRRCRYDVHVAFDPYGFALFQRLFPGERAFYYSLELYLREDHFGLDYPDWLQDLERREIHQINGLIIQSAEKDQLFRRDYQLQEHVPGFLLPVTYQGRSTCEKTTYLRDVLGIPAGHRIALHLGGISELYACIELVECFGRLQDWSLVFHGYPKPDYLAKLKRVVDEQNLGNVHVHDRPFDSLARVDELVQSADVGIAWYEDISVGFRTAGMSSGKIPSYLKFGLPVVAKRYPSTELALENPHCGLCVDRHDEIPAALSAVLADYAKYSVAACEEYDRRYRFENYEDGLSAFLGLERDAMKGR